MAGSLADFKYLDNSGKSWLVRIDRSNALSTGTGFVPIVQADMALDYLPRNIKLRYIEAKHPTRPIKRIIYCQSIAAPIWIGSQSTINLPDYQSNTSQSFKIGNRVQETSIYRANLIDSYQNDSP